MLSSYAKPLILKFLESYWRVPPTRVPSLGAHYAGTQRRTYFRAHTRISVITQTTRVFSNHGGIIPKLGMFHLILTVLNTDNSTPPPPPPYYDPYCDPYSGLLV